MTVPPLRILMISSTFRPLVGGAETYALMFAEGMTARGHDVTVVTDGTGSEGGDAALPFRVVRLTEYRRLLEREGVIPWEVLAFGLLPELERALSGVELDVVVTNSLDAAWPGKVVALARGIPWCATFHEQSPEAAPMGAARLKLVYEILRPDVVLAGSDHYARRAEAFGRRADTVRIEHGIDTESFHPDRDGCVERRRRGIDAGALVLLCAGRLTPRKGIPDLLEVVARLVPRRPELHVVVAGTVNSSDRAYAAALREQVSQLAIGRHVTFEESAQPADMPGLFAAADVVVQPSYAEGLGLAVLEAMSAGRPVVTTDIPATRQITKGENVLVAVEPGDLDQLASEVDALLADRRRREALGAAGRAHVVQHFSRDAMLEATEAALGSLSPSTGAPVGR